MKFRSGFITNSSSSSYLCVYKVNASLDTIKEEFGKFGEKIVENYIDKTPREFIEGNCIEDYLCDSCDGVDDCSSYDDCSMIKEFINSNYFYWEDGAIYLSGNSNQGYGGDYDITDDSTVQLGKLLCNLKMAKCIYQGEPN